MGSLPRDFNIVKSIDKRSQVLVGNDLRNWWGGFNRRWKDCQLCPLSQTRNKVVQFRGIIPARILFIGEAPGDAENEFGRPFIGPAGRLLDTLLEQAGLEDGDYCIINVVGCQPPKSPLGKQLPPEKLCVKACRPRLIELINTVHPKLIVTLGAVATKVIGQFAGVQFVDILHPSHILQHGSRELDIKRFVLTLRKAVDALSPE